jgi:hypothetical protein
MRRRRGKIKRNLHREKACSNSGLSLLPPCNIYIYIYIYIYVCVCVCVCVIKGKFVSVRAMKVYVEVEIWFHSFSTSALREDES